MGRKQVDVSVIRWQNFTGNEVTLESTGETFSVTAVKRANGQTALPCKSDSSATKTAPNTKRTAGAGALTSGQCTAIGQS
jgi:hypothetical protein